MIGCFWNCRGIGKKKGMTPYIRDLIKEHNLDFICFQETIQKDFEEKYLRSIDPAQSYL